MTGHAAHDAGSYLPKHLWQEWAKKDPIERLERLMRSKGWAGQEEIDQVYKRVREEVDNAKEYYNFKERCIFCDIIRQEAEDGVRTIAENQSFIALAPYAPRFPFEMWIVPKVHQSAFEESQKHEFEQLAVILKDMLARLDRVLDLPAYNYIIHSSPIPEASNDYYHWHIEIMPKLTKVAGFEWGTGFYINPTPPEESAKFLREAMAPVTA